MLWRSNEVHIIILQSPLHNEICVSYTPIGFFSFFPEEGNGKKNKDANNNNKQTHLFCQVRTFSRSNNLDDPDYPFLKQPFLLALRSWGRFLAKRPQACRLFLAISVTIFVLVGTKIPRKQAPYSNCPSTPVFFSTSSHGFVLSTKEASSRKAIEGKVALTKSGSYRDASALDYLEL